MYPLKKKNKKRNITVQVCRKAEHTHTNTHKHAQICIQLDRALNEYIALEVQHLFASFRTIPAALISQTNNTTGTNMRCLTYGCNDYLGRRESYISEL